MSYFNWPAVLVSFGVLAQVIAYSEPIHLLAKILLSILALALYQGAIVLVVEIGKGKDE